MKTSTILMLCACTWLMCVYVIDCKKDNQFLTLYWPRSIVYVYPNKLAVQFEALDTTLKFNSSLELNNYLGWIAIREQGIDKALHHDQSFITVRVLPKAGI